MTLGKSLWVSCDGGAADGTMCDEEITLMGLEATPSQVRKEARKRGWVYVRSMDLCPKHRDGL